MHSWDDSMVYRTKPCENDYDRCTELTGGRMGYFPGTITSVNADGTYAVTYDAMCGAAQCVDANVPPTMITTLGQGSNVPAATTWRVPDAPASVTFGEILADSVEVKWKPPPFDGNTNHEITALDSYVDQFGNATLYPRDIHMDGTYSADPAETMKGGIVRGYRLFMQVSPGY